MILRRRLYNAMQQLVSEEGTNDEKANDEHGGLVEHGRGIGTGRLSLCTREVLLVEIDWEGMVSDCVLFRLELDADVMIGRCSGSQGACVE